MNTRRPCVLVALLAAIGAAPLLAQEVAASDPPYVAGPIDRFGPIGAQQIQVNAGTGDDSASIAFELPSGPATATRFGFILSTPLNGEKEASPATLDGLADGTRLSLRIGRFDVTPFIGERSAIANAILAEARAECERVALNEVAVTYCRTAPGSNVVGRHLPQRLREYLAQMIRRDAREYGVEVSVGVKKFDFVDPATLAARSVRKVPVAVRAGYTQYRVNTPTAFTGSIAYQRAFVGADEQIFCPPNPGNVVVTCTAAPGAPPERDESLLLAAGIRHRFAGAGVLRQIAIAPLVTYDALGDVAGIDVPFYFIPDRQGGLTGGVRFGYRSDTDKLRVGLFIGAAFNILQ